MTRFVAPATALLLGLVLAMTSVSMAIARGGMSPGGTMILCIDGSQQVVRIGADGQPEKTTHPCPDCTMGALAFEEVTPLETPQWQMATLYVRPFALVLHEAPVQGGQGRDPPVLI